MSAESWQQTLEAYLPEHAVRAASREIATLARRLDAIQGPALDEPQMTLYRMLAGLRELHGEYRQRRLRLAEMRETLRASGSGTGQRAALRELILAEGGPGVEGDLKALERWLDGEALELRHLLDLHPVGQQWQMLAEVTAAFAQQEEVASELASSEHLVAAMRSAIQVVVQTCFYVLKDRLHSWQMRAAACALVGTLARLGAAVGPPIRQELLERSSDVGEHPWVQSAALAAYVELRQQAGESVRHVLREVLRPSDAAWGMLPADHCFLRARALRLAGEAGHLDIVADVLMHRDPSQHVQIEAARTFVQYAGSTAGPLLDELLTAGDDLLTPKGRAALAVAAFPDEPVGDQIDAWRIELIGRYLACETQAEPASWVIQAILDRRTELSRATGSREAMVTRWRPALLRWTDDRFPADLIHAASAVIRWLDVIADQQRATALLSVSGWFDGAGEGRSRTFHVAREPAVASLAPAQLLDVLQVVAHDDFDLLARPLRTVPLRRGSRGYRLSKGVLPRFAIWRFLYELVHPAPDKRQAFSHVVDRVPNAPLLALSTRLSEVTETRVPGQRVSGPARLDWGADLPLPAVLVAAAKHGSVLVSTPGQRIELSRLRGAWRSRWAAQRHYVRLARLRRQALERPLPEARQLYDAAVQSVGFRITRHSALLPLPQLFSAIDQHYQELLAADVGTLGHLSLVALGLGGYWMTKHLLVRRQIARERACIPLSIGGWGSRGKSGTERLKAGLFHGLGYRVVAKTTGCEAMFIASLPGLDPLEIYLFRPYDKATIWEQRFVLKLGVGLRTQVFLWECMALKPSFVTLLQQQWMRDDIATITNTYPDHEDIQGPSGRDVADTVARFVPTSRVLITSEQHMIPVLREEARNKRTALEVCLQEEWALLPDDLLARFPYFEHPKNIALVVRMAARLGVPRDVALKEMADNVVPDLGVLKEYGPAAHEGRTLSFINGMSANERAGHLSNWQRLGLGQFERASGLSERMCLIINNRADRLARQATFEQITIHDTCADAVFVIGTNVGSFADNVQQGLKSDLRRVLCGRYDAGEAESRTAFLSYLSERLRRRPLSREAALELAADFCQEELSADTIAAYWPDEMPLPQVCSKLIEVAQQTGKSTPRDVQGWARFWLAEVAFLQRLAQGSDAWTVAQAVDVLVALLGARTRPLHDPGLSGDQVLHTVTLGHPPGSRVRILGCQNIKGTGLGVVYRWISVDAVLRMLEELEQADASHAGEVLRKLGDKRDLGIIDLQLIVDRLDQLRQSGQLRLHSLQDDADRLQEQTKLRLVQARGQLGGSEKRGKWWRPFAAGLEELLDWWDSRQRKRKAAQLYRDLMNRRVGYQRAALEAKKIVNRQKGGWLGG